MSREKNINFLQINEKTFVDIPSSEPKIMLPIDKVGISNRPIVLNLTNPLSGNSQQMACELRVSAGLPAGQRGLHMSRIEECLDEIRNQSLSPSEFCTELAKLNLKTQNQRNCLVELEAELEHKVKKNTSGKSSIEIIKLHCSCEMLDESQIITLGVSVPFMNACPCTQRWAIRDFYKLLLEKGCSENLSQELAQSAPLQAHTNGGLATLTIRDKNISHKDLYDVLDISVPIVREMLKGIDEHSFVRFTHEQGQFCEDNVRSIAANTVSCLENKLHDQASVCIEVEVNESVHFHNLRAEIKKTFAELRNSFI